MVAYMKFGINRIRNLCLITALLTLVSCVGVVEDKNIPTTKSSDNSVIPLAFDGIFDAIAVGHNKVDVFFFPATGGSGNFSYLITYDGIAAPISVPGEVLRPDYRGLFKYTVNGLEINKLYTFQVQARDISTDQQSFNTANFKATTFSNKTCDFTGIVTAFPLPGSEGLNAIKVTWHFGYPSWNCDFPDEQDPIQYVITVIDADALSPGQMNDTTFGPPLRRVYYADKTPAPPMYTVYFRVKNTSFRSAASIKDFSSLALIQLTKESKTLTILKLKLYLEVRHR